MGLPKNRIPALDPSQCANEQVADITSQGSKHFPCNVCIADEYLADSKGWERGDITGNGRMSFKCCFFLASADIMGFQNSGESEY